MLDIFSICFAKSLGWTLRAVGRHGATLPGLIIERLHPGFLDSMLKKLPDGVIVVSGTNGKTTTTKVITELLRAQNKKVLTNKTGGNFVRGIFATVAQAADLRGRLDYDVAVLELDEAYAVHFVGLHHPRASLLLNITRDQLDRFGEIDTTAKLLGQVAAKTKDLLVLNGDDSRIAAIKPRLSTDVIYFGISEALAAQFPNDEELYGSRKAPGLVHKRLVELVSVNGNLATYKIGGQEYEVDLQIDGQHNALNGAAALTVLLGLYPNLDKNQLLSSLSQIKPAFGRGEMIDYHGSQIILQLVKNPASFRQALHVLDIHKPTNLAIVINDDYADGRDVSWLWDVEFEVLKQLPSPAFAGGIRAYDIAVRLQYDEVPIQGVNCDIKAMVDNFEKHLDEGETGLIYATYSAMLAIRKELGRRTKVNKV